MKWLFNVLKVLKLLFHLVSKLISFPSILYCDIFKDKLLKSSSWLRMQVTMYGYTCWACFDLACCIRLFSCFSGLENHSPPPFSACFKSFIYVIINLKDINWDYVFGYSSTCEVLWTSKKIINVSIYFGPQVYPMGSVVIILVRPSVCPSISQSLNIPETAY